MSQHGILSQVGSWYANCLRPCTAWWLCLAVLGKLQLQSCAAVLPHYQLPNQLPFFSIFSKLPSLSVTRLHQHSGPGYNEMQSQLRFRSYWLFAELLFEEGPHHVVHPGDPGCEAWLDQAG